jgi:hypothetical protein
VWFRNFSNETHDLILYDTHGRKTFRSTTGTNRFSIAPEHLAPGVYLFTIQRDSETRYSGKLMVL